MQRREQRVTLVDVIDQTKNIEKPCLLPKLLPSKYLKIMDPSNQWKNWFCFLIIGNFHRTIKIFEINLFFNASISGKRQSLTIVENERIILSKQSIIIFWGIIVKNNKLSKIYRNDLTWFIYRSLQYCWYLQMLYSHWEDQQVAPPT